MEVFRAGWRSAWLPKWKTWELEKPPERSHECLLHRKEEKEDNVSKTIFPRIKKKELECQRKAMLCVFITGPRVYVHICIWRYVHGLCCCGRFSITCKQHCRKDGVQSCWEAGEAGALLCSCGALREPAPKPPCQA